MSDFVCYTSLQVLGTVSGKKDHRLASEKSVLANNTRSYHWITYNSIKNCRQVADILQSGNANLDINNVMRFSVSYLMLRLTCLFHTVKKIIALKI